MKIQINLGDGPVNFVACVSAAPQAYDGFGTIELDQTYLWDRPARLILVRSEHVEYHKGRAASGLHAVVEVEGHEDCGWIERRYVAECLWGKVWRGLESSE